MGSVRSSDRVTTLDKSVLNVQYGLSWYEAGQVRSVSGTFVVAGSGRAAGLCRDWVSLHRYPCWYFTMVGRACGTLASYAILMKPPDRHA